MKKTAKQRVKKKGTKKGVLAVVAKDDGLLFTVLVVTGATTERVIGVQGDMLRISVMSDTEHGRANLAVLYVLGMELGVDDRDLRIVRGFTTGRKRIFVRGMTEARLKRKLKVF